MRHYAKSTLPFVAGLFVSVLLINAASTDIADDSASVKTITNREIIDLVSDMDQAMVIEGPHR